MGQFRTLLFSIRLQPEELLRGGEGIGVRTRRGGKVGERAGDRGRCLQIEPGVGPAQHQLIVQELKTEARGGMLEEYLIVTKS